MECLAKDGKESVTLNNTSKYCYEHSQIYNSLRNLHTEVSKSHVLSWGEFLTRVLDPGYNQEWKNSLVERADRMTLETIGKVAKAELGQI